MSAVDFQEGFIVPESVTVLSLQCFNCLAETKLRSLLFSLEQGVVELEEVDLVLEEELVGERSELVLEKVLATSLLGEVDDAPAGVGNVLHLKVLLNCELLKSRPGFLVPNLSI